MGKREEREQNIKDDDACSSGCAPTANGRTKRRWKKKSQNDLTETRQGRKKDFAGCAATYASLSPSLTLSLPFQTVSCQRFITCQSGEAFDLIRQKERGKREEKKFSFFSLRDKEFIIQFFPLFVSAQLLLSPLLRDGCKHAPLFEIGAPYA